MNETVTKVSNRHSCHLVEIHYKDAQGRPAEIALTPEHIVELYLASEQQEALRRKWQEDYHYAYQNARLLDELLDYLDIISETDFDEHFADDPAEYKKHWAEWLHQYTQQRKARVHFFTRKKEPIGEQS